MCVTKNNNGIFPKPQSVNLVLLQKPFSYGNTISGSEILTAISHGPHPKLTHHNPLYDSNRIFYAPRICFYKDLFSYT